MKNPAGAGLLKTIGNRRYLVGMIRLRHALFFLAGLLLFAERDGLLIIIVALVVMACLDALYLLARAAMQPLARPIAAAIQALLARLGCRWSKP